MSGTVLDFESYRTELHEARGRRLAGRPAFESPFGRYEAGPERALNDRQLAHRQRMLAHLQRQSSAAS